MGRLAILVGVLGALPACYQPTIESADFACGPAPERACPEGFTCAGDDRCYLPDQLPTPFRGTGALAAPNLAGMSGTLTLDPGTGEIRLDTTVIVGTSSIGFDTGFTKLAQLDGPPLSMWSFADLTIPTGINIVVAANNPTVPVLAATNKLIVGGDIDLAGRGGDAGAPGQGGGNVFSMTKTGGSAGTGGGGGGGGGYGTMGGQGGGAGGGAGGGILGDADIIPVHSGAGGGGGSGTGASAGGAGGGTIVLLARELSIAGKLNCGGQSPVPATGNGGGGGGGSGGGILLSADTVSFMSGHVLDVSGGVGAAGAGTGGKGGDGGAGRIWIGSLNTIVGTPNSLPQSPAPTTVTGAAGVLTALLH